MLMALGARQSWIRCDGRRIRGSGACRHAHGGGSHVGPHAGFDRLFLVTLALEILELVLRKIQGAFLAAAAHGPDGEKRGSDADRTGHGTEDTAFHGYGNTRMRSGSIASAFQMAKAGHRGM